MGIENNVLGYVYSCFVVRNKKNVKFKITIKILTFLMKTKNVFYFVAPAK